MAGCRRARRLIPAGWGGGRPQLRPPAHSAGRPPGGSCRYSGSGSRPTTPHGAPGAGASRCNRKGRGARREVRPGRRTQQPKGAEVRFRRLPRTLSPKCTRRSPAAGWRAIARRTRATRPRLMCRGGRPRQARPGGLEGVAAVTGAVVRGCVRSWCLAWHKRDHGGGEGVTAGAAFRSAQRRTRARPLRAEAGTMTVRARYRDRSRHVRAVAAVAASAETRRRLAAARARASLWSSAPAARPSTPSAKSTVSACQSRRG